jgi:hypothetical protein
MKISDGLKRLLPRTHHGGFSTAAFQNDFEEFSRVCEFTAPMDIEYCLRTIAG